MNECIRFHWNSIKRKFFSTFTLENSHPVINKLRSFYKIFEIYDKIRYENLLSNIIKFIR